VIPLYILTNRKHHWLLPGFAYLFNQFWGSKQPVVVVSYGRNDVKLPHNFSYLSLSKRNYPAKQWSNGFIKLAQDCPHDFFMTMLEDFWLNAPTDVRVVETLFDWMCGTQNILRLELWGERKSKKQARHYNSVRGHPLIYTPPGTKYQMSLQANIWNRDLLLDVLEPGETPWQVEIWGSSRVSAKRHLVLGAKHPPLRYEPIFQKGSIDQARYNTIPARCRDHIERHGWLTP
jgi:hypothetical protein